MSNTGWGVQIKSKWAMSEWLKKKEKKMSNAGQAAEKRNHWYIAGRHTNSFSHSGKSLAVYYKTKHDYHVIQWLCSWKFISEKWKLHSHKNLFISVLPVIVINWKQPTWARGWRNGDTSAMQLNSAMKRNRLLIHTMTWAWELPVPQSYLYIYNLLKLQNYRNRKHIVARKGLGALYTLEGSPGYKKATRETGMERDIKYCVSSVATGT
jgi:hypothetical protein